MVWGRRREEGSGWGTRVYLWWIHVDIWQNQYNIVKLKNKKKVTTTKKVKIMALGPITSWQIDWKTMETVTDSWAPKSLQMVTAALKIKYACSLEEKL